MPDTPFSAEAWNKLVRQVLKSTAQSGRNSRVKATGNGRSIDYTGPRVRHPWHVEPFWNPNISLTKQQQTDMGRKSGQWCFRITPGFINGLEPCIRMPRELVPEGAAVLGNNYGKNPKVAGDTIEVLLTDPFEPFISTLSFVDATRITVSDSGAVQAGHYPDYFKFLGALPEEQLDAFQGIFNQYIEGDIDTIIDIISGDPDDKFSSEQGKPAEFPHGKRRLFSTDIALHVNRPGIAPAYIQDRFGVTRPAGYNVLPPDSTVYQAFLYSISKWSDINASIGASISALGPGSRIELPQDEIKIATVYFLSPEDSPDGEGDTVDATWQPFVAHDVFWNLMYRSLQLFDEFRSEHVFDDILNTLLIIGFGSGFLPAASITEPIEVAFDIMQQFLNETTMAGRFWTAG